MRSFCVWWPALSASYVFGQSGWKGRRATLHTGWSVVAVAAARALRMHLIIEGAFASVVESVNSGLRKPKSSAQFARRASKSKPKMRLQC